MHLTRHAVFLIAFLTAAGSAHAGVGDPQIRTDHPWYPGELACSTFERLFATQAAVYERVTGTKPVTDEQRALAAWLWRNTHYWHGEEGAEDLWGKGFQAKGSDLRTREYWTGMFAHGFGLCGTTHNQWIAEMEALFGHSRGRSVGVDGHNSFEVYLTGGPYGAGKWVLLDHDVSSVVFDPQGKALLSIPEIQKDFKRLTSRTFMPERQPWLVCGLHPGDGGCYARYDVAEYLAGYAGPPPMVHLRRGETLRRHLQPGLEDGKTFVFWGRNYMTSGVPGPERSHTWVNQPDKMYKSKEGTGYKPGQARFANAVYVYRPDFASDSYKEGVVREDDQQVVLEFQTPYIIAATPPNSKPWGIYDAGCKNGLVLRGKADCSVSVSTDRATWSVPARLDGSLDLTDLVKGRRQYALRFNVPARKLKDAGLTITTVCQCNSSVIPRLKDEGSMVTFAASGQAVDSAGPNLPQAQASHLQAGKFGSPKATLGLTIPRGQVRTVYAAAHWQSGNPPRPELRFYMDYSTDGGVTWKPMVKDWSIPRRGQEPADFWSQSLCWGSVELAEKDVVNVEVRFHNNGGKNLARAELHLVYRVPSEDGTRVTFAWTDERGPQTGAKVFQGAERNWRVPTGKNVQTRWVEYEAVAAP